MRQYSETARKNRSGERQAGMVPQDTRISVSYMASQQVRELHSNPNPNPNPNPNLNPHPPPNPNPNTTPNP